MGQEMLTSSELDNNGSIFSILPLTSPYMTLRARNTVHNDLNSAGWNLTETRTHTYTVYHNGAWYGMAALSVILVTLCGLFAGLTLALCGLDMTWLQIASVTGNPKKRYLLPTWVD
jgi:hypothetical protein